MIKMDTKKLFTADERKGFVLGGIGVIGVLIVWVLTRETNSVLYGIPAIPLIWGRILLYKKSLKGPERPVYSVLAIIIISLFIVFMVIGAILAIAL
jgi:hypothetical protein